MTATSLQASDFVFGAIKVLATDNFAIDASVTIGSIADPLVQFTSPTGGTLINKGSMILSGSPYGGAGVVTPSATTPDPNSLFENDGSFSVTLSQGFGVEFATLHNTGTFNVTATDYGATGATGDVVNSGHMTIVGGITGAVAVDDQNTQNGTFQNLSGGVVAVSAPRSAYGVELHAGTDFENAGQITVSAATAYGVAYQAYGASNTLVNTGTINVTGGATTGMAVSTQNGVASVSLTNSGTITAQTAIQYSGTAANITNTGIVNGAVQLGDYNNTILNNGTINGAVVLGNGTNTLDSGGFINGSVYLGTGSDTVYLSKGNATVFLAAGTHVVTAAGGIVTASYANAASGVDVNLFTHGKAENTGVGTDTLVGFSALIGSAYNDTLEGGGSLFNSTQLTGGGGADTFVWGRQDGSVAITDFSAAQGDKIDLSTFWSITNFSDLLANAQQIGSDTIIAPPPQSIWNETLTLKGVTLASLTASDFYFYPSTVTGTAANNYTVSVQGVLQQYRVDVQGAKVMGGPDNVSDALTNIQRIQFVDGYLATSPTDTAGQVYRIYEATLNRAPDPEGLANWVHAMASGTSLQTVANGFVNSQEFQATYGSLSNTDFVTLLYHNVLHRAPDASGLSNWVGYLNSGAETRAQVVLGFSESQEDIANLSAPVQQGLWIEDTAAAQAARLYDTVFGRLPDAGGLVNWTHSLEGGMTLQTAAADFVASQEFQSKYGSLDNNAFLTLLYQNVLHRAPDASGMSNWLATLAAGHSRAEVVLDFSESQEHVADTAPHIDYGVWIAG